MFKFNALIPELSVSHINKSLNFYLNILLFKVEYVRKDDKFALISLNDSQIMIEEINGHWQTGNLSYPFGRGIKFQRYPVKIEMQENWYRANNKLMRNKEFLIMDPDGYLLRVAQDLGEKEVD